MFSKHLSYFMLTVAASLALAACGEANDDEPENSGLALTVRSVSIDDGATIDPVEALTVDYNSLIAIDASKAATVNGTPVQAHVNPGNGMQLVVPLVCEWNKKYTVAIPDGFVYSKDAPSVTAKGLTVTFTTNVEVEPAEVAKALTNANATAEAKALYQELLDNYGKVMYSGAMGGVAWETGYTDYINEHNGGAGYPKVVGFDFIHLAYSPANWINYGDISPVLDAWKAGSIPTITWHWNVPTGASGGASFNTDSFSTINALTPGTVENGIINADIEKVAGYLKLLQDAKIPILFRPLHEAAGDYTWGAWFWWGKDGVEATKQLWNYLRQKFEGEYGINNLIWVWTMQTSSQGKPASVDVIRNAYPGNEAVDMVGVDLYPDNAMSDQTAQFQLVNKVIDGKKIVTLSEVGNLVDPAKAAANNALWSYFMNWYDYQSEGVFGFKQWNSMPVTVNGVRYDNPWVAVANSEYVVNR